MLLRRCQMFEWSLIVRPLLARLSGSAGCLAPGYALLVFVLWQPERRLACLGPDRSLLLGE